jgi:chromosome segregation ATPase
LSSRSFQEGDQLLLPEINDIFQGGLDFPSDSDKSLSRVAKDTSKPKYESDDSFNSEDDEALEIFEALTSSKKPSIQQGRRNSDSRDGATELAQLKALVEGLKQREMKLEAELVDYYGLKEQQKAHLELERQLRKKTSEIEKLNGKLIALEEQKKKLSEEVRGKENLKKELDMARAKVKELQKTIQSDAGQTKAHLLILKQQVAILQEKEQEGSKKDFDTEKKLQALRDLEVEVLELKRTSKELQHQKRELTVQLAAAEAKIAELSSLTEVNPCS